MDQVGRSGAAVSKSRCSDLEIEQSAPIRADQSARSAAKAGALENGPFGRNCLNGVNVL
ncbi:MAG: hypothetical protein JO111_16035 [Caulobacteraceae bacterium]|nr:hypothetical protein [Caulobacteraceae bacterium]